MRWCFEFRRQMNKNWNRNIINISFQVPMRWWKYSTFFSDKWCYHYWNFQDFSRINDNILTCKINKLILVGIFLFMRIIKIEYTHCKYSPNDWNSKENDLSYFGSKNFKNKPNRKLGLNTSFCVNILCKYNIESYKHMANWLCQCEEVYVSIFSIEII